MHVHTDLACLMQVASIMYILNEGFEIRDFPGCKIVLFCWREIPLLPDCLTRLFLNIHIGISDYLLSSFLGISSHLIDI